MVRRQRRTEGTEAPRRQEESRADAAGLLHAERGDRVDASRAACRNVRCQGGHGHEDGRGTAVRFPERFRGEFRAGWADGGKALIVSRVDETSHVVLFDRFWVAEAPTR